MELLPQDGAGAEEYQKPQHTVFAGANSIPALYQRLISRISRKNAEAA
jgi:hypothetical protein